MALLMIKSSGDELTPKGVKSSFTLDIPQDRSTGVTSALTQICGWGWRFSCRVDSEANSSSPRLLENGRSIPWRRVTVIFHADLIRNAQYGRIAFSLVVENLDPLEDRDTSVMREFDLPVGGYNNAGQATIGTYMRRTDAPGAATVTISVDFPTSLGISLTRPLDGRVETALAETIRGKEIVDLKFYAFSRVGDSYVARPRPLFAKMSLLRGHSIAMDEYLDTMLTKGYRESQLVDLDVHGVEDADELFSKYDYMSDSDLDSDVDDEEEVQTSEPHSESDPQASSSHTLLPSPRRVGQVIFDKGHAYNTWNALFHYLYTKKIEFRAPGERGTADEAATPKCSPKSMYKLADAFELTELKTLALASLRSQLTAGNIVREAFSTFTSLFTEIQDLEVEFLLSHVSELGPEIATMLRQVCRHDSEHCVAVLWKLICRMPMDFRLEELRSPRLGFTGQVEGLPLEYLTPTLTPVQEVTVATKSGGKKKQGGKKVKKSSSTIVKHEGVL